MSIRTINVVDVGTTNLGFKICGDLNECVHITSVCSKDRRLTFKSGLFWLSLIQQHHCEKGPSYEGVTKKTLTEAHEWMILLERNENRERIRDAAHLEHHPVLFLRLLNHTHVAPHCDFWHSAGLCRSKTWSQVQTSFYTRTLSIKVFVCGSGRAPPSFAALWYITVVFLLLRVARNTSLPETDAKFYWLCHFFSSSCSQFKCYNPE